MSEQLKKIYLAIPYSGMQEESYAIATRATALLMATLGHNVFSPITHSHPLTKYSDITVPGDWSWWEQVDYQYLDWADEMWIIVPGGRLDLVNASTGVQAEIDYATENGMHIRYITLIDDVTIEDFTVPNFNPEQDGTS